MHCWHDLAHTVHKRSHGRRGIPPFPEVPECPAFWGCVSEPLTAGRGTAGLATAQAPASRKRGLVWEAAASQSRRPPNTPAPGIAASSRRRKQASRVWVRAQRWVMGRHSMAGPGAPSLSLQGKVLPPETSGDASSTRPPHGLQLAFARRGSFSLCPCTDCSLHHQSSCPMWDSMPTTLAPCCTVSSRNSSAFLALVVAKGS